MPDDRLYDLWVCVTEDIGEGGGFPEGTDLEDRFPDWRERHDDDSDYDLEDIILDNIRDY